MTCNHQVAGAGAQQRDRAAGGGARRAEREEREPIPSSRPFFARLELKRESAQPPRLNRGSLYQCQVLGALPTTATILICPASVGSDVPGLYPGEAGAHPARGSNQFGPRSSVIRAHLSEG